MPRFKDTIRTDAPPDRAFAYMASFDSVEEWDPSVVEAQNLDGRVEAGTRFRVVVRLLSRESELVYEMVEYDPPRRAVLRAETATVVSLDTVTVEPAGDGGAAVTYDASLELKGAAKLAALPMKLVFDRISRDAREGLTRELGHLGGPAT
jgi:hypothetical protein